MQPIMGDLPKARIKPARAFQRSGVDFVGPLYVKASLRRNAPKNKAYACVWVCLVTKAVHIKLVSDLTTKSFINAIQRFCDRSGISTNIYSDNATNFVDANRELQELRTLFLSANIRNYYKITCPKSVYNGTLFPSFPTLWRVMESCGKIS